MAEPPDRIESALAGFHARLADEMRFNARVIALSGFIAAILVNGVIALTLANGLVP